MAKPDPKKAAEDIEDSFANLRKTLQSIGEELGINVNKITEAKKEYRSLLNIAEQLQNNEEEISKLSDKQVKTLRSKAEANLRDLKIIAQELSLKQKLEDEERALLEAAKNKFSVESKIVEKIQEEDKLREKISKNIGITGVLLKGMSKIPIVGELLKTDEALEAAKNKAREGGNAFQVMGAAFGSMGKSLLTSLKDPLVLTGLLVKGFKALLDLGFRVDVEVTNLSKSMAVSKTEAEGVRNRFAEIQNSSQNIFETSTNLVTAQLELADATGATRGFTEQQLKDQILLTKQMGLSGEEAAGLQQFMLSSGKSAKDVTKDIIKQTSSLAKQTGIQLDNKKVIGEVAKVSGQLRLQYSNNPALIAKAVVQTQKLGISLEQAKKAAEGLLNFEESIENELSAELLTGKELNLERARALALNGDSAAAMEEIASQVGTAADFSKMNVIQQEALAKAVGMSADELADSLVKRENLAKLGDETRAQLEEQIELAKQQGDQDKVNMLERSLGSEEEAQAALERVSEQDKFNQSVEKLKSIMSDFLAGPAMGIAKWLTGLLQNATMLKGIFIGISTVVGTVLLASFAKSIASLSIMVVKAVAYAAAWAIANPFMAAIGLAAAAGVGALVYSQMKDGAIDPKGGMIVSGEKGSIQLDKEDSVIAGTNLFGKKGNKSGGGGSSPSMDLTPLIAEIRALASRPVSVAIDGVKVIEATTGKNPDVDSNEMNKNSYKVQ
jgi:hypothetical protein